MSSALAFTLVALIVVILCGDAVDMRKHVHGIERDIEHKKQTLKTCLEVSRPEGLCLDLLFEYAETDYIGEAKIQGKEANFTSMQLVLYGFSLYLLFWFIS